MQTYNPVTDSKMEPVDQVAGAPKEVDKSTLKILAFTNNTASAYWRFNGQADRINANTEHEMFVTSYQTWNNDIVGANLVILEQLTNPGIVDLCHERGAKVIFEADDAMIDSYGHERKNLQRVIGGFKENAIETIAKCDAVTVTTEELKENYARFTKAPIYVLPNYIDYRWYGKEKLITARTDNEIRVGWFGSRGHFEDLRSLVPTLNRILEKYPNVKFVYCGYGGMSSDKLVTEIGWGEDVFKEIPRGRREFYLSVGPDYWALKHKLLDIDIGICPLVDDYFNRCKTPIKWIEYSALETPSVCSNVLYDSVVKHGKTGFLASNEAEWEEYLSKLIEDSKLRKEMGQAAKRDVNKKHDLDLHWKKWLDVYQEVLTADSK